MTQLRTIKKDLERKLEIYSVEELIVDCRRVLKELREYPNHNSYQIKYYERFWILLSKY